VGSIKTTAEEPGPAREVQNGGHEEHEKEGEEEEEEEEKAKGSPFAKKAKRAQ
jgi:hypothetical protein